MIKNANSFSKLLLIFFIGALVVACGGKKVAPEQAAVANTNDITRPPSVVKNRPPSETESNPDETISYDEWRRRRDAEQAASQAPADPDE